MATDYCEYCNATLPDDEKLVTVYRHQRGKHFIFERVPARVCSRCGERYISAQSVSKMESRMREQNQQSNLVSVPVIELQPAG